jgi:hypothetical protein
MLWRDWRCIGGGGRCIRLVDGVSEGQRGEGEGEGPSNIMLAGVPLPVFRK